MREFDFLSCDWSVTNGPNSYWLNQKLGGSLLIVGDFVFTAWQDKPEEIND